MAKLLKKSKGRIFIALILLGGILAGGICQVMESRGIKIPSVAFLNVSQSLPRGLYLMIPGDSYRVGDLVVYEPTEEVKDLCMERGYSNTPPKRFLKRIAALEGDLYGTDERMRFYIQGKSLLDTAQVDSKGQAMPVYFGENIVPEGEFLPLGTSRNSLDGRYTGTVPLKNIKSRAVPVLVEWGKVW